MKDSMRILILTMFTLVYVLGLAVVVLRYCKDADFDRVTANLKLQQCLDIVRDK